MMMTSSMPDNSKTPKVPRKYTLRSISSISEITRSFALNAVAILGEYPSGELGKNGCVGKGARTIFTLMIMYCSRLSLK